MDNEHRAVRQIARRIEQIFDDDEGCPFLREAFSWAPDGHTLPTKIKSTDETLDEIIEYITADIRRDELVNYVREAQEQRYFEKAWKGSERFRTVRDYFDTLDSEDTDHVFTADHGMKGIRFALDISQSDLAYIQDSVARLKKSLTAFESHLEAYQGMLNHRLEQIHAVQACIEMILDPQKGEPMFDGKTPKEYLRSLISSTKGEDRLLETVRVYLEHKDLDSPVILDHAYTASHESARSPKGLDPKPMKRYFDALERNTRTNAESCGSIMGYCRHTREQIDRIVVQECRKMGIEL